jgi:cob(I)alamin adenosyltransferase
MRIYTRKGDRGDTGTLSGGRVRKSDSRIRALGCLDELNAQIGLLLAGGGVPGPLQVSLRRIQDVIFEAGATLASSDPAGGDALFAAETAWLEAEIDKLEAELPPLTRFILPGGSAAAAGLHLVRTVARRAECQAVEAACGEDARMPLLTWLNRLSDALFVYARTANRLAGQSDTPWESRQQKSQGQREPKSREEV